MKRITFKVLMARQKLQNKVQSLLINKEGGDEWFTMALKIVLAFIVGALVLALLYWAFGDGAIGGWMKKSTTSWFPTTGELRPTV